MLKQEGYDLMGAAFEVYSPTKVGYLINFGASKELEWKRFAL